MQIAEIEFKCAFQIQNKVCNVLLYLCQLLNGSVSVTVEQFNDTFIEYFQTLKFSTFEISFANWNSVKRTCVYKQNMMCQKSAVIENIHFTYKLDHKSTTCSAEKENFIVHEIPMVVAVPQSWNAWTFKSFNS